MTKPDVLSAEERTAWDGYAASAAQATLQGWFRWKLGCPVNRDAVIAEATAVADLLIIERRKR